MLALIEQKCVLDLKGVLMVGKHIYFSSDSVFCTYNAKKAADRMVLTLVGSKWAHYDCASFLVFGCTRYKNLSLALTQGFLTSSSEHFELDSSRL